MRTRRHHNNKGLRQIKRGKTHGQVKRMARKLKLPLARQRHPETDWGQPVGKEVW